MFPVLLAANENTTLLQVDKEEVRLRRTVASKKDEYYLDGKHVKYAIVFPKPDQQCYILLFSQAYFLFLPCPVKVKS